MQLKAAVHDEAVRASRSSCPTWRSPESHEVRVRDIGGGVCHSDLHPMQGLVPHPSPAVHGHEGAGIIEAVGPDVSSVHVGDRVLSSYIPSCGRC